MRTTVHLDEHLLAQARRHAAGSELTLTAVLEQALRESFARRTAQSKAEWVCLKTVKGNGVRSGLNLDDSASLLDVTRTVNVRIVTGPTPLTLSSRARWSLKCRSVHTGVGPLIAVRYPTLQIHVRDWQLFGLHGLDETGRCVDQKLTRELHAHRRIRFGAPTAKNAAARGCGQVDSSSWRSNRPAGRGQRFALPTARASAHLTTAFHHDYQGHLH